MGSTDPDRPDPGGPDAAHPADPLGAFVPDPAVRAELARRMSELADLVEEAGEALGEILAEVQRGTAADPADPAEAEDGGDGGDGAEASRGRDSAERSRGASRSST